MSKLPDNVKLGIAIVAIVAIVCVVVFGFVGFPSLSGTDDADATPTPMPTAEATSEPEDEDETGDTDNTDTQNSDESIDTSTDADIDSSALGDEDHESSAFTGMTEEEVAEYKAQLEAAANANYDSTPVSYVYNDNGDTITVGVEGTTDGEGIYLIPSSSAANAYTRVGFYILRSNNLEYGDTLGVGTTSTGNTSNFVNFVIVNQTYDKLWAATYTDYSYPVRWVDASRASGGITRSDTIYMRAVDLVSHDLLATFQVEISYNAETDTYYISDIHDSDVSTTGELSDEDRANLVSAAVNFITTSGSLSITGGEDGEDVIQEEAAVVECVPKTYFRMMYSTDMTAIYSDDYIRDGNIYAVNIPVSGLGFVTIYYVPEEQIVYGFTDSAVGDLVLYGLDALTPFTIETILTLDDFVPNA